MFLVWVWWVCGGGWGLVWVWWTWCMWRFFCFFCCGCGGRGCVEEGVEEGGSWMLLVTLLRPSLPPSLPASPPFHFYSSMTSTTLSFSLEREKLKKRQHTSEVFLTYERFLFGQDKSSVRIVGIIYIYLYKYIIIYIIYIALLTKPHNGHTRRIYETKQKTHGKKYVWTELMWM